MVFMTPILRRVSSFLVNQRTIQKEFQKNGGENRKPKTPRIYPHPNSVPAEELIDLLNGIAGGLANLRLNLAERISPNGLNLPVLRPGSMHWSLQGWIRMGRGIDGFIYPDDGILGIRGS